MTVFRSSRAAATDGLSNHCYIEWSPNGRSGGRPLGDWSPSPRWMHVISSFNVERSLDTFRASRWSRHEVELSWRRHLRGGLLVRYNQVTNNGTEPA